LLKKIIERFNLYPDLCILLKIIYYAMPKTMTKSSTTSSSNKTDSQKLAIFRSRFRKGDITAIAKITGYDPSHVSRVLRGKRVNPSGKIVNAAYSRVSKRKD
jgi:hypothetical protein